MARARAGLEVTLVRHPRFSSIQVIVPDLDPAAVAADADRALEDYVSSLSTLPAMDPSRPLWELRLLPACTRSAADPGALPAMLPPAAPPAYHLEAARRPAFGAPPRPAWSAGAPAVAAWALLAWHTLADAARFVALALELARDPRTLFAGVKGVELRRKRFVSRGFSLDDVKHVKNALGCALTVHWQSYVDTVRVVLAVP